MRLSLIIPAYNEEKRIPKTLIEYNNFLKENLKKDFEIIVIPNNCNDNTLEIVKDFSKKNKQTKFFNIPGYCGKGNAVMKGFKIANGDYIGFVDADNSISPKEFYKLYLNLDKNDGIISSRKIKGAEIIPKRNLFKTFSSGLFNKLVRTLFYLNYQDTQCGAKLFTRETIKKLLKYRIESGWGFDVDILNICEENNLKILEYPITWSDKKGSKLNLFDELKTVFKLIFINKSRNRRYGKI